MGSTQEDGVTAVLGSEADQKRQASVWPEPLGFVRELQLSSRSGCGGCGGCGGSEGRGGSLPGRVRQSSCLGTLVRMRNGG